MEQVENKKKEEVRAERVEDKLYYKEYSRFHKLLHTIFNLCDLAGFRLEGRLTLVDKRTGKVWK